MVMPGETITGQGGTGETKCDECGMELPLRIYQSNAGYYVGTWCNCGPYSRESTYYQTLREAVHALESGDFGRG